MMGSVLALKVPSRAASRALGHQRSDQAEEALFGPRRRACLVPPQLPPLTRSRRSTQSAARDRLGLGSQRAESPSVSSTSSHSPSSICLLVLLITSTATASALLRLRPQPRVRARDLFPATRLFSSSVTGEHGQTVFRLLFSPFVLPPLLSSHESTKATAFSRHSPLATVLLSARLYDPRSFIPTPTHPLYSGICEAIPTVLFTLQRASRHFLPSSSHHA